MKKLLVIFAFLGMSLTPASAQEEDQLIFNHLGIGVSVGTTALGINVLSGQQLLALTSLLF